MKNEDFRDFYRKYYRFSIRIANQIVKNQDTAEDIAQDVFYKFYEIKDSLNFGDELKLRALVKRATINKALDYCKLGYVKQEIVPVDEEIEESFADERCSIEARILNMEENEYARLVLQKLHAVNPMNYDILVKVKYLDISPDEVAREYGITRNNVNNRIRRTKLWIDEEMSKIYKE